MSHGRRHESSPVQLFPFLAVLVSALGALVLLLLTIQHRLTLQLRAQAVQTLLDQVSEEEIALVERKGELEREVGSLHAGISRVRGQDSALDHELVKQDRQVQLELSARSELSDKLDVARDTRSDVELRIAALRQEIAAIAAAKTKWLQERPDPDRTFVPVIHPGVNGTARRPIYIECTDQGATFQPEGIVVSPSMLKRDGGELLARAVQALVQYYLERDVGKGAQGYREWEPYPLVLVRPSGCMIFYPVRHALESAGFTLGYELIESDWALQFPKLDSNARGVLAAAIERRTDRLVAGSGTAGELTGYGSDQDQGASGAGDSLGSPRSRMGTGMQSANGPAGSGTGATGVANGGAGGGIGSSQERSSGTASRNGERMTAFRGDGSGSTSRGTTQESSNVALAGGTANAVVRGDSDQPAPGSARGVATNRETGSAKGHEPFQSTGESAESDEKPAETAAASGRANRRATGGKRPPNKDDQPDVADSLNSDSGGSAIPHGGPARPVAAILAPTPSNGKILVSRTIVLDCWEDSLVLRANKIAIPFPESEPSREFIAHLVRELEREVMSWGPSGMTFRWKPTLLCMVHPGGLGAYHRLRTAFVGSSIELSHLIAVDDRLDWDDSIFLRRLQRSIEVEPPWAE